MPLYEYTDSRNGATIAMVLPVSQRDDVPPHLKRVSVPSRINVCPRGEPSQAEDVMSGFKEVEQQIGTTELMREIGMSPNKVKEVWAQPYED